MGAPHSAAVHPDLQKLLAEFEAIQVDAGQLVEGLAAGQFNWRPSPESWSIAQCITHLNVVDGLDLGPIRQAMDRARQDGLTSPGPYRYGALSSYFIRKLEPPATMKTKAPKVYVPPASQDPASAMAEFRRIHDQLTELVISANGLDLGRVKVPTPVSKFISFSLGQRFRLIAAHDRRHLYQAWQVRRALP